MRPMEILLQEHRLIELAVQELESFAENAASGIHPAEACANEVIAFLREFADGLHRTKEECLLFPRMMRHGFGPDTGLISVMLGEHREDAICLERVAEAMGKLNGAESCRRFASLTSRYVHAMRTHMRTEKTIVFWVASRLFTLEDEDAIMAGFERIDAASQDLLSRLPMGPLPTH